MEKSCQLSVLRFGTGTLYVVLTGYVEMLRGAKGTSAQLREKENGKWKLAEHRRARVFGGKNFALVSPRTPVNAGPKAVRGFCRGAVGRRRGCGRCRGERVRG